MRRIAVPIAALGLMLALAVPALGQGVPVRPGSAPAAGFVPAATCTCHGELSAQWRTSMHERAIYDPAFQVKVADAERLAGADVAAQCARCHSPIGNIVRDPYGVKTLAAAEGISCMFCHQVVGDTGMHDDVSQLLQPDLTRQGQLQDPQAPHKAAYAPYYKTSAFCGDCHERTHPGNGLHIDTTYSEWASSTFAKKGIQCQDCHMSLAPGVGGPSPGLAAPLGPQRSQLYQMTFVGANVGQGPSEASRALLKSAATIKIVAPSVLRPGTDASISVIVTNTGAGHDLPTGVTEERQLWLTVYAEQLGGKRTKLAERHFGTVFSDSDGNHPAELWDAAGIYSDDRIPAGGSATLGANLQMPLGIDQTTVLAVLNYRSLSANLASRAQVDNPTTVMALARKTSFANELLRSDYEMPVVAPEPTPPATIWTPLVAGMAFAGMIGFVSVGILVLQNRE